MNLVPSLDQLAADPAKAQGLPRPVLLDLAVRALAVHAAVTTALIATTGAPADTSDRLLSAQQVAERLGTHVNFVYAHREEFPFTVAVPGRKSKFSERGLSEYIASRAAGVARKGA